MMTGKLFRKCLTKIIRAFVLLALAERQIGDYVNLYIYIFMYIHIYTHS